MVSGRRTVLTAAIAACLGVVLFTAIVYGADKMEPLLSPKGRW